MRRVRLSLVLLLCATACAPADDSGAGAEAELVRTLFTDAWNTGDLSALGSDNVSDSILFHYRGATMTQGLSDLAGLIAHWRSAFPDLRMEVLSIIQENDLVAAHVRYSGTHQGTWFGIPPTGASIEVDEMMFFRFEAGRLVEAWEVDDQLTMRTQMGLVD